MELKKTKLPENIWNVTGEDQNYDPFQMFVRGNDEIEVWEKLRKHNPKLVILEIEKQFDVLD